MRLLLVIAVVATAAPAAASVIINKTPHLGQTQAYVGGTVAYDVTLSANFNETNLVVHDPTPAGHTLTTVASGATSIDCTQVAGGPLGSGVTATCNVGGELQVTAPNAPSTLNLTVTYRVDALPAGGASNNTASVTCTALIAGTCPQMKSASIPVLVAPLGIGKSVNKTVARPGEQLVYTLTATSSGSSDASGWSLHDVLPAGLSFVSIKIGPNSYTAAQFPQAAMPPTSTTITLSGNTLDMKPPTLAAGQTFTAIVTANIDGAASDGTVYSNTAQVTAAGGAPVSSRAVTTTVSTSVILPDITKSVSPNPAKPGDTVNYTITVTPPAPLTGPLTLTDLVDPALHLTGVKVNGAAVACTATPVASGPFSVGCGTGAAFELDLPSGAMLSTPVTVVLTATVLPSAGNEVPNVAHVTVSGTTRDASAPLSIANATLTGASLTLTAGRVLAEKGDLVPFIATIGVPAGAAALASPVLLLSPSHGLRPGDVRVGGVSVRPVEMNGQLQVSLPAVAPGTTLAVEVRARVNLRAQLGLESRSAAVQQTLISLASARADVRIEADPDFDLGAIVGEVYRDENGNGVRDRGEPGLEGALIVMDDGLQVVTDREGRYHLAAIVPGERAIKLAKHSLPPDSKFTTDETRVVSITPGILIKVDWGVRVPVPEAPPPRAAPPTTELPELRLTDAGGLVYRVVGAVQPGSRVSIDGRPVKVQKSGAWASDVILQRGRTRLGVVTELPDGRVVLSARDVYWIDRQQGGSLIVPRAEEPRLILRFPGGALAEQTFQLEGTVTAPIAELTVAGQKLSPDAKGHVALRLRVPDAGAGVEIQARFADGMSAKFSPALEGGGDYWLLVGIAEGKVGYVTQDKNLGNSGIFAEGRVKLYAKGRIQGRWLIEGGINLDSTQISDWRDLFRGDPQQMFRNLDPDRFYTVYGDASQTTQGAPTRARLYVRICYDRSELLFGNFQTGMTGVEFGRYSRAVTGARATFVRASTSDPNSPPSTQVIVFGAWLQTARAHDELRGTGGSMYYLSHRNIVEGSEQIRVELRDVVSDQPVANQAQRATADYEVDYLAGRLALREPLSSIASSMTLVRSGTLDGDKAFLVADYEYIVVGDVNDGSAGARVTQQAGPVRFGGSFANEFRAQGGDYMLLGGDVRVDLKKYGSIVGEVAWSSGALSAFSRSDDGGLTYSDASGTQQDQQKRQGWAWKGEADLHFFGISLHPYARGVDQGYTDTSHSSDSSFIQWGVEAEAAFWQLKLRLHYDERRFDQDVFDSAGNDTKVHDKETRRDAGGEVGGQWGRVGVRIGARTERADDSDSARTGHRTTVAARLDVSVVPRLTLYLQGQYAVEHNGQGLLGIDNSLGAVGMVVTLPWNVGAKGEVSYGAQGWGGLVGLKTDLSKGRVIYGTVTLSQDRDDRLSSTVAAGGRERIDDKNGNARAFLFAEDQFRDGPLVLGDSSSRAHMQTAGLDVPLAKRFLFSATFERGQVTPSGTPLSGATPPQPIDRTAGTASASYGGDKLRVQVRGELRTDHITDPSTGIASDELSWLASGMITATPTKDLSFRGKALFSDSKVPGSTLAKSSEADVGFSWRPSFTDRLALFGRYAYLDEGIPPTQVANAPALRERSHVLSLAGEGRLFWRISLSEKVGAKHMDEPDLHTSDWLILWVNRVSLHVTRAWDAIVEYRLLYGPGPTLTNGVSLEVNRIIVGHLRLGAGWNFAKFSDDELQLGRGSAKGFFVRAEGFY